MGYDGRCIWLLSPPPGSRPGERREREGETRKKHDDMVSFYFRVDPVLKAEGAWDEVFLRAEIKLGGK